MCFCMRIYKQWWYSEGMMVVVVFAFGSVFSNVNLVAYLFVVCVCANF